MSLEETVQKVEKKPYLRQLGENLLHMGPAFLASTAGVKIGGRIADSLPDASLLDVNAIPYAGGFLFGFGWFYAQEFIINRNKYPNLASKEFAGFCANFYLYDICADAMFYTPEFAAVNTALIKYGGNVEDAATVANVFAGTTYMLASAKLWPATLKMSSKLKEKVSSGISNYLHNKPKREIMVWCAKDLVEMSAEAYSFAFKPAEVILDYVGDKIKKTCSRANEKFPILSKKII